MAPPLACRKGWEEEAHANFATVEVMANVPMSHRTHDDVHPILLDLSRLMVGSVALMKQCFP
jgi:hypothetical protein